MGQLPGSRRVVLVEGEQRQRESGSLAEAIERVRSDKDLTERAERLLARDKELLDRLAK